MPDLRVKMTGNDVTETKAALIAIIPQVRYHPSIKTSGVGGQAQTKTGKNQESRSGDVRYPQRGKVVQKYQNQGKCEVSQVFLQTSADNTTGPKLTDPDPQVVFTTPPTPEQALIIPQVRYHPSIQMSGVRGQAQTRTTKNQNTRSGDAGYPQRGKVVQKYQNQGKCEAGDSRLPQVLLKTSADTTTGPKNIDPDPQVVFPTPLTPDPVLLGMGIHLDRRAVDQVEVLTRGQRTNQDWFRWRKNRITASVAHRIAHSGFVHGKTKIPPASYLADITGEGRRVQTRAMSWGVEHEAEAVCRYQSLKSTVLRHPVSVQECGLFIDAHRPWLAASPDGIVTDRDGQWLLCLEVKCPYKHRHRRVEDACRDDPAFCLQIVDDDGQTAEGSPGPRYRLKASHSYFTQIQCQLAVTGLLNADLVVFTLKETAVVPVTFDPELWAETVSRLEVFYKDALLPHLQQKTTAWSPEL